MWESGAVSAAEVLLPRQATGTFVRLYDCHRPHGDALTVFSVLVKAPGLRAEIGIEPLRGDRLAVFVGGLDETSRGWSGTRRWSSFCGDLQREAA